jgi:hypothetical protein
VSNDMPFPRGVNQPGREDDHSPPSKFEVKNVGAIPSFRLFFSERRGSMFYALIRYKVNCLKFSQAFQYNFPTKISYKIFLWFIKPFFSTSLRHEIPTEHLLLNQLRF